MKDARPETPEMHVHGPQNAEHELRKAYYTLIETDLAYTWDHKTESDPHYPELVRTYRRAFGCYRDGNGLAAERWAVGSSRVDLQACKLEYSIVSPK